ncbi:ABC transporter substrate-binding protein [Phenylobacterium sp.]|jgi:iron complex transport system substrate-binding protein|uniref:ABC transporter substrate-binding protein n=1 Tax=Phenylobacterium sp. TaxID=1871053 RepID=UPI002E31E06F|nr:ABC transporter substrate-binding protein [Phenylobacterium sp.]HEX3365365.1 ABC transporter substrate-binding protein [Phenylobacterium sp.]
MRPALRVAAIGMAALTGLAGPAVSAAERGAPQRIMSLNVCTDLLLLELAPRARIASVTFLAPEAAQALFPGATAGVALNHGSAEDIVNVKPDLILDSGLSNPMIKRIAKRMGAPVVEVKNADSFADIRDVVRQVGAAVGEGARAEALIAQMDAELADLAAHPPARRLRVVAWSGGSSVPGKGSLTDAIITAAGAVNIAAQPGASESTFGVEELLAAAPDALLYGGATLGRPSLLNDEGQHRAVRQLYAGRRIAYNDITHTCGVPQSADSARDLRRALGALPARAGGR